MIDVLLEVCVWHKRDKEQNRTFTVDAKLPALQPDIASTRFKLIHGVDNALENVSLDWNQLRHCYVIAGELSPNSDAEFDKMIAAFLKHGWTQQDDLDTLWETLLE